ncbi:MAG TPA: hypothetical protein VNO33_12275 [Kofleriaceae bacterium]|nr:hypothetical protein [Kofleriaceae bacterium]
MPVSCLLFLLTSCGASPESATPGEPRGCPAGDITVQVNQEAAELAACTSINADLTVGPSFALRDLTGLARLRRVTGAIDLSDNIELAGFYMPRLVAVGGDLVVENNRQVATVSLHRLVEVGGDLIVRDNRGLLRLDLGALRRVGGRLEISGHPALEAVVLDRLERAGELVLEENPAWPAGEAAAIARRLEREPRTR